MKILLRGFQQEQKIQFFILLFHGKGWSISCAKVSKVSLTV